MKILLESMKIILYRKRDRCLATNSAHQLYTHLEGTHLKARPTKTWTTLRKFCLLLAASMKQPDGENLKIYNTRDWMAHTWQIKVCWSSARQIMFWQTKMWKIGYMCLIIQLCSEAALVSFFVAAVLPNTWRTAIREWRNLQPPVKAVPLLAKTNKSVSNVCKHVAHWQPPDVCCICKRANSDIALISFLWYHWELVSEKGFK